MKWIRLYERLSTNEKGIIAQNEAECQDAGYLHDGAERITHSVILSPWRAFQVVIGRGFGGACWC